MEALITAARGQQAFTTFELPVPARRIAISASEPCELVFVGYED